MIAAIYARKSNDQTGVADEAKSVTRQIEHARQYAVKKGWQVADDRIFVDDGISGATFNRPGLLRMMTALKPKPPFEVVIVACLDRLGREQIETAFIAKQLSQAGVKIFSYLSDKEIALSSPTDKFLLSAMSFGAELERAAASQRTADAMLRKARAGHVCGGACFGYENIAVAGPDGRRSHVERKVNEAEAAIVRCLFALCAAGKGVKTIAKTLNADGAPSPRPQQGRPRSWAPSSVRSVLYRDLYRGVSVWNRTKQSDAWGQRAGQKRPPSEWVTVAQPELRIVSDELWSRAHARLDAAKQTYLRSSDGNVWGRPPSGVESKYLLSGLMRCACCGAALTVRSSSHGRRRFFYFVCASYDHRGHTVCANNLPLPMAAADEAILTKMRDYVFDLEIVEGAIADAVQELRPSRATVDSKRTTLLTELRRVEDEQGRFVAAIAAGGHIDALARALQEREQQRTRLQQKLAALDGPAHLGHFNAQHIEKNLRGRLKEWRQLLHRQMPLSRQAISCLLDGRIAWTPRREEGRYEFTGRVKLDRLLSGFVVTRGMASPTQRHVAGLRSCFRLSRARAASSARSSGSPN